MFEQYSDRAMRVIFIARLKAGQDGAPSIDVPHLLASLLIEDQGGRLGQEVTGIPINGHHSTTSSKRTSGVDRSFFLLTTARRLLRQVEMQFVHGKPNSVAADLPLSSAVKNIVQAAQWLKERFERNQVTPLHLLAAALLRDAFSAAIFREAGVTADTVLQEIGSQKSE